jgi:hypothetical protein
MLQKVPNIDMFAAATTFGPISSIGREQFSALEPALASPASSSWPPGLGNIVASRETTTRLAKHAEINHVITDLNLRA